MHRKLFLSRGYWGVVALLLSLGLGATSCSKHEADPVPTMTEASLSAAAADSTGAAPVATTDVPVESAKERDPKLDFKGTVDGYDYTYWQRPGSCRELTLVHGDTTWVAYDENDDNVIGSDPWDEYRVTIGQESVRCDSEGIERSKHWPGEKLDRATTLRRATDDFQDWRRKIFIKHNQPL